jgi:hypothetical protein
VPCWSSAGGDKPHSSPNFAQVNISGCMKKPHVRRHSE